MAMKRANIVFQKGVDWISKNKEHPFFIFLHFFDAHWPYQAPEKFGGNNAYEEEVAYSAHYLDLLLEKLEEMNLLESTSVICFSDHGEDLNGLYPNDKGGKELGHPEESGHGCLLYEQTQKVVLILKDLSLPQNVNFMDQVRLVDIMPTTLELMGIEYNKEKFDGVSLLPIIQHGVKLNLLGYSETFYPDELLDSQTQIINIKNKKSFVIDNKHKIILHLESDNVEYYDIENDPNETKNLFSAIVR